MSWVALFPGQGSQAVGMGVALRDAYPQARQTWEEADDALGESLSSLTAEGPIERLTETANAQPAILTCSIAAWRVFQTNHGAPAHYFAGHSLGEYSALVASGALAFSDAVRLVRARGELMQAAVPSGEGGMAAVMGLSADQVEKVCAQIAGDDMVLAPANMNGGGQVVIAGHSAAVKRSLALFGEQGARRVVELEVSAPFHCSLMAPAAEGLRGRLAEISFSAPSAPVYSNVEGGPNQSPDKIAELLTRQVTCPVRWEETILDLGRRGVDRGIEFGHGRVLAGLARRIDRDLQITNMGEPAHLEAGAELG